MAGVRRMSSFFWWRGVQKNCWRSDEYPALLSVKNLRIRTSKLVQFDTWGLAIPSATLRFTPLVTLRNGATRQHGSDRSDDQGRYLKSKHLRMPYPIEKRVFRFSRFKKRAKTMQSALKTRHIIECFINCIFVIENNQLQEFKFQVGTKVIQQ